MRSLLVALFFLFAAGCSTAPCHCPAGGARVPLPANLQSQVTKATKVTGDSCGLATDDPTQGIYLNASKPGTCHVSIELANGDVYAVDVVFASQGGCCASGTVGSDASTPVLIDGASG
jgi:hypothetical protein